MTKKSDIKELERKNRRDNIIFGTVLFIAIIVVNVLFGMAGIPIKFGPV